MDGASNEENEKPDLQLIRGNRSPHLRGRRNRIGRPRGVRVLLEPERELERAMRDVFVVMKGVRGTTPSRGLYAIACGDATPWRALGLRCLEGIWDGVPDEKVLAVGEVFLAWLRTQVAERRLRRTGAAA